MKNLLILCLTFFGVNFFAQSFISNDKNRALTFKEIQLQFREFKATHDLKNSKHWKYFKRYEVDMQLHSNGHGEPDGFSDYIFAAINAAGEKKAGNAIWYPSGPNSLPDNLTGYMENGIGRFNCIAFHPTNAKTFYVGVAQGGLWKTTDGGNSYTPLTDHLPITRISDICIDPSNSNNIYISVCDFEYIGFGLYLNGRKRHTHYGLGVYKSTDGGASWNPTGLSFQMTQGDASLIKKILVNPTNSSQVIACGVSGIYTSQNGGLNWTKKLDSLFWDMVQDPVNPQILYAASGWVKNSNAGMAGIYKSTDFGNTWNLLNTGIAFKGSVQRIKLAIAPSDPNYIYALCCDNTNGYYGMFKSINAGNTWSYLPPQLNILDAGQGHGSGGQGTYDLALYVDPVNKNKIFTGGINIWGSFDGGVSFSPASHWTTQHGKTLHGDIHAIDGHPLTGDIYVSTDGGLYKTSNLQTGSWGSQWPTNWTNLSNGIQVTSFYRLSSSKNTAGRIVAGAQDNATFYYDGNKWSTIFGGDGMDNYLDPLNNKAIVGSSQYGTFYYSNDNGYSGYVSGANPDFENAEWVTPVAADYNVPGVLYVGNENLVKSIDGGQSWSALGKIYSDQVKMKSTEISAVAVSPANSQVIYAARRVRYELGLKGVIIRTTNGGSSFTNITGNLPDSLFYTGIEASPTNSNEAVVCMAGFVNGCKIYKTKDAGLSWTNISYNLPNIPVNCIKYLSTSDEILAATDVGLYLLSRGSDSWINCSQGLPNVIVSDIEINPANGKIYVSTFGRGIWESNTSALVSGIQKHNSYKSPEFNVYPSINTGDFIIESDLNPVLTRLDIFDIKGSIIYSSVLQEQSNPIHLKTAPGAYYLRLQQKDGMVVKKIIIE